MTVEYFTETTIVGTLTGTMIETVRAGIWSSEMLQLEDTWEGTKN